MATSSDAVVREHIMLLAMDRAAASRDAYVEAGGTVVELSDEDRAAWANAMPNIAQERLDDAAGWASS